MTILPALEPATSSPRPSSDHLASNANNVGFPPFTEERTLPRSHQSICRDSSLFTSRTLCFSVPFVHPNSIILPGAIRPLTDIGNQDANPLGDATSCHALSMLHGSRSFKRVTLPFMKGATAGSGFFLAIELLLASFGQAFSAFYSTTQPRALYFRMPILTL